MMELAQSEWERAKRSAASARLLVETDPDSAASRAFYSAFHALSAAFALRGQTFAKHTAIRSAMHRDLVRPGLLPEQVGHDFDHLTDMRGSADYWGMSKVCQEDAVIAVEKAEHILEAVGRMCPELNKGSQGA
jgi:uncharacterized protein (UPF0332 family)